VKLVEGTVEIDDLGEFLGRLDAIAAEYGCTVQAFDARYVVGPEHLARAVELADRAIERGENVARDRAVEILLYAAGRRQIDRALELGVSEGPCSVVVLVDGWPGARSESGDEEGAAASLRNIVEPSSTLGSYDEELIRQYFDVSDAELAAAAGTLDALVLERVALLDVEK
jgi:KEOPS complex subunit Cgi121